MGSIRGGPSARPLCVLVWVFILEHPNVLPETHHAYACGKTDDITVLIEPLNRHDAPGYFLSSTDQAERIIAEVSRPNLKLMFDCYRVGRTEGDLVTRFKALQPIIGHVQFASVPDRGPPDSGEIAYGHVFRELGKQGWKGPLGAEYRPEGDTEESLNWLVECSSVAGMTWIASGRVSGVS